MRIILKKKDTDLKNTIEWIIPNAQRNMMEPIRLTLAPGGATYPDLPREGEEFGYVLQGSVKIHVGNKVYKAKKGRILLFYSPRKALYRSIVFFRGTPDLGQHSPQVF